VGRLNPIKGMSRVVEAWVTDDSIRDRYNLLIVGGDLATPSKGELEVLESICEAAGLGPSEGLLLLGGRSHREVSLLMAAASEGMPDEVGSDGIYVSGSEKEEFGLAIVEALAFGLPVIGPEVGGPATYVEHGFTGFLTDTTSAEEIQRGIKWAETARRSEVRADAARRMVRTRYSLTAMAAELVDLYNSGEERRFTAS
jgi:glycosyltransferase involved in cell wall biosynthesis